MHSISIALATFDSLKKVWSMYVRVRIIVRSVTKKSVTDLTEISNTTSFTVNSPVVQKQLQDIQFTLTNTVKSHIRVNIWSTHSSLIQFITESNLSIEKMNVTKEIYATAMICIWNEI